MKPSPSALSSAVSTISTITLTENDNPEDDGQEESDEVPKQTTYSTQIDKVRLSN